MQILATHTHVHGHPGIIMYLYLYIYLYMSRHHMGTLCYIHTLAGFSRSSIGHFYSAALVWESLTSASSAGTILRLIIGFGGRFAKSKMGIEFLNGRGTRPRAKSSVETSMVGDGLALKAIEHNGVQGYPWACAVAEAIEIGLVVYIIY